MTWNTTAMNASSPPTLWDMDVGVDVNEFLRLKNEEFTRLVLPAIVILAVLFVVGVVGNSLVLYVYNRRLHKGTIRWFIQALAVFDLLSCLVAIPGEIVDMRINYTFGLSPMCQVLRTVSMFCTVGSGVTLIVVAVERYKRICTPLRRQISPKEAQIIIGLCAAVAVVCASPAAVLYGQQSKATDHHLIRGSDCSTADTFKGTVFPLVFSAFQCLLFVGGALVLVVLYVLIGRKIWTHERFRRDGFNVAANRRMSFIFAGSECSSPTTEDVVFTFPYRRSGAAAEASSDSNNGNSDAGTVCDNNNLEPRKEASTGHVPKLNITRETDDGVASLGNSLTTETKRPEKTSGVPQPASETLLRKKSILKSPSSEKVSPRADNNAAEKPDDTLLKKKSLSRKPSQRERNKSGDSGTLRGRYKRRNSAHTQFDMRRFLNRSDSVGAGTRRTTLMLFLITVVYVLSFLPYVVLMVVKVLDEDSLSGRGDGWELAHNILLRSYFINSMANPIIYSFCSRTFRKETNKIVHCRCRQR